MIKSLFAILFLIFTINITPQDSSWTDYFKLSMEESSLPAQHTRHLEIYGKHAVGYSKDILAGIDIVQKTAPDGGGYFADIKAVPLEAPIGYNLQIFGKILQTVQRKTSYCSGATYAAFIEALNLLFRDADSLTFGRYEALRMLEMDRTRREDGIKFWGRWNDDGPGTKFALVDYADMGEVITLKEARPGDFMNISWVKGGGHSVVFLGWYEDENNKYIRYWSSQKATNGLGDQLLPIDRIHSIVAVRLTQPVNLFSFTP